MPAIRVAVRARPLRVRSSATDDHGNNNNNNNNNDYSATTTGPLHRSLSPRRHQQETATEDRSILQFPDSNSVIIDLPSRLSSPPVPQLQSNSSPVPATNATLNPVATSAGIPLLLAQLQQPQTQTQPAQHQFTFDTCYPPQHDYEVSDGQQELIFHDLGLDIIDSAFNGYNGCVFAYGQTGSGKTHSMLGPPDNPGLIPRICENIFQRLTSISSTDCNYKSHKVSVSFMEIYNERVRDLLSPETKKSQRIREHPSQGPYVEGLSKYVVSSSESLMKWIRKGMDSRAMAETMMNEQSSRSHAIIVLNLSITMFEPDLRILNEKTSKICLVDLAGSERSSTSQTTGDRLKEGSSINKSLTTLGLVIKALADKSRLEQQGRHDDSRRVFVPYRDSVLTWLLKECLGGNSKTIMLATVNPSIRFAEETMSTLRYANRAKNIINRIQVNEDPNIRIIKELKEEIRRLKDRLAVYEGANGDGGGSDGEAGGRSRLESGADISITSGDVARLEALLQESTKLANLSWEQRHAADYSAAVDGDREFLADDNDNDDDDDDDDDGGGGGDDIRPIFSAPSAASNYRETLESEPNCPISVSVASAETHNAVINQREQERFQSQQLEQPPFSPRSVFILIRLPDGQQAGTTDERMERFEIPVEGITKVGSDPLSQTIVLDGIYIESQHAQLEYDPSGNLFISPVVDKDINDWARRQPLDEMAALRDDEDAINNPSNDRGAELPWIYVNGERISERTQLFIGSRVMFSRSHVFQVAVMNSRGGDDLEPPLKSAVISEIRDLPDIERPDMMDDDGEDSPFKSPVAKQIIETNRHHQSSPFTPPPSSAGSNSGSRTLYDASSKNLSANLQHGHQLIQIPYYERVVDELGRPFYTFHIYLTLPTSVGGAADMLPITYHVSRRFREFNAFHRQWNPYMPALIDRTFPSQWSTLFSGSSRNAQTRRHRLELFLNSFLLWWIQKAREQYRREVDVDLIQRKLWLFSDLNKLAVPSSTSRDPSQQFHERRKSSSADSERRSRSRTSVTAAAPDNIYTRLTPRV